MERGGIETSFSIGSWKIIDLIFAQRYIYEK